MDSIKITGGVPLEGKVEISGAKNAALPLMAACLLTEGELILRNIPHLSDITTMANLLVHHGAELTVATSTPGEGRTLHLCAEHINDTTAPYEIVRKMRASVVVLGPILARCGRARVSLPGGCAIGTRPIDLHLKAMAALGAEITLQEGYVEATAPAGGLRGAEIMFEKVSVGATENALMAASLARGTTVLKNAAREPEISDLAECLVKMGAHIEGIGTDTLLVQGVKALSGAEHSVMPDRIEAGSYAIAGAITGGNVLLTGIAPEILGATLAALREAGIAVTEEAEGIRVRGKGRPRPLHLTTAPYPGFATDMQAQMSALLCLADGTSTINEDIFENRFMHVPELQRMGANISQSGNTITIRGIPRFIAAEVMATDLRASLSLVIAGLAAEGTTTIHRVYHLDRGYERVEEKLAGLGARVERIKG